MSIKKILPDLAIIFFFFILSAIYNYPELSGEKLPQNDVLQAQGASKELRDYKTKTGKVGLWTNSMFSGMPANMVYSERPNSLPLWLGRALHYSLMPFTINTVFMLLVTSFLAFLILGFDRWIGVLGAIGIVFASYNFINIDAGHVSKLVAQSYGFPLIASVIITFRGKYLLGGVLTALFAGLELYSNHVQITYYIFIILLIISLYEFIRAFQAKQVKEFMIGALVLLIAGGIAFGSNASLLVPNYEYSKQTIRGPSELTTNDQTKGGGLDIKYAFQWSYGKMESFTVLVPNFYGGASGGELSKKSNMYETLTRRGVQGRQAEQFVKQQPLYWGDMPFTSGPAYYGAIICFLFVFSLIVAKNSFKWWLLGIVVFLLLLSWGRNLTWFNDFFFYNVPLYNKFRAVNMLFSLINIFMVWGIALGLKDIFNGEFKGKDLIKPLGYSVAIVGGLAAVFALLGGGLFSFEAAGDQKYLEQLEKMTGSKGFAMDLLSALQADRASLLKADALRSLIFILLAAGVLWAFFTEKIKKEYALVAVTLLILVDLWGVNKRYLNTKSFKKPRNAEAAKKPQPYDLEILQKAQKDPHYRVLNTAKSPMNDATTSFHHKSIGGYHGAKLRRYQELADAHFTRNMTSTYMLRTTQGKLRQHNPNDSNNVSILSMLNMRFLVDNGGKVFENTNAMGHAWFVDSYKVVNSSDEELALLTKFDPKKIAFINPKYAKEVQGLTIKPDNNATIKLLSYAPDVMKYEANVGSKQLAVFSEIFYDNGARWVAYIDGKPVSHLRVNYVLRALVVPAGKHTIEFRFISKTLAISESIALISSILLLLGIAGAIGLYFKKQKTESKPE
ncbi:hypothetical protein [Microscilla marina]|uniref:Membrane protein, putative n=1 Tax=Microscilla marina ATCC 23134 TaxID=313606 RepID=A1ZTZ7_MICM2|nr:hypothetical protein [Microscilla marina]EAY26110.1 membrane protein, putative [Microscilla marina ATCC 23134]